MTVEDLGIDRMTDDAIEHFLSSQDVGVLGLPTGGGPYLVPMSFGFDGGQHLYFSYVTGAESRKAQLSDTAETACFLVYNATSKFTWQSVSLTGTLSVVPESDWDAIRDLLQDTWRPAIFDSADLSSSVTVYQFQTESVAGYKQNGLPPGFEPGQ